MKKNEFGAFILSETKNGERIVSCGGRISTKPGTAIELYKKATDKEKNLKLVSKVVSSGHKTVLEHHYFNLAFNNVSIFIEQFLIEFRLASFTIKSGRYVNFSNAGFNLPDSFTENQKKIIKKHYNEMFKFYDKFVFAGIPVEDARFILPYGLKTNIYMSLNARELVHVICTMIYGRGKYYEEIYTLGMQLKEQLDKRYPNLVENSKNFYTDNLDEVLTISPKPVEEIKYVYQTAKLLSFPKDASKTLDEFAKFTGYNKFDFATALKDDKQAKLLEHFNYTFKVENFAFIILKHLSRHRMQSLATAPLVKVVDSNKFIIPKTIKENAQLTKDFEHCIKENRELFNSLLGQVDPHLLIYITPHAAAIDLVTTMNARELLHLCNLRTCTRAQWVIRDLVTDMLKQLKHADKEMFKNFGSSCYTYGFCPEGRMCCGKQQEMKKLFDEME